MGAVTTIAEKCRRCFTCVRECPAKAIKVEGGQAQVLEERCIACGNCVKVCGQQAKQITNSTGQVEAYLRGDRPVFACLAPSMPAAFPELRPGQVLAALRRLGFHQIWEVAVGAELIAARYQACFKEAQQAAGARGDLSANPNLRAFQEARSGQTRVITSACPAVVAYIEKFAPSKRDQLAPIVSPMIATARLIRALHGHHLRIVFIGPCIAKKVEILDPDVAGAVDAVLTFAELEALFTSAGVVPAQFASEDRFDGPSASVGRTYAISSGLLKTAGLSADILQNDVLVAEGKDRVIPLLNERAPGATDAIFLDLLLCEGCINGPMMPGGISLYAKKEIVARHACSAPATSGGGPVLAGGLDLSRAFTGASQQLPEPSEEAIRQALSAMKKERSEDQLNCGACGYAACRAKAVAVCQGLAEPTMCLPYLIDELEHTCSELRRSSEDLETTQAQLHRTERIASLGKLSAGFAHEINNPLATILLYSHVLLRGLGEADPRREDVKMIVNEADRCKRIARGLLDFARQSRSSKAATNLARLVREVVTVTNHKNVGVRVVCDVPQDLPALQLDASQIKQVLVNLVENAIDASPPSSEVHVKVIPDPVRRTILIAVSDTGCGIPPENLPKLFTPFFTTKEVGKGTGLGLSITYGIVKMHSGDIAIDSEIGRGTTVRVTLPMEQIGDESPSGALAAADPGGGEMTP